MATHGCCDHGWKKVFVGSRFCTQAEQFYAPIKGEALTASWSVNMCTYFILGLLNFTLVVNHKPLIPIFGHKTLDLIVNPQIINQNVKLLPFCFNPVNVAGKKILTPDCLSRGTDSTVPPIPPARHITFSTLPMWKQAIVTIFGPPTLVLSHLPVATLAHMVKTQPTLQEHQGVEILEHLVVSLDLPSVEALEERSV